jgi:type I restriction enzyme S subunit
MQADFEPTEIGEIPEDWQVVNLRDIVREFKNGFASGRRDDRGIVQIRMNNVTTDGKVTLNRYLKVPVQGDIQNLLLRSGDLLFNNTNSIDLVGKSAIFEGAPFPCTFSNHFTRIRADETKVVPRWILYHLLVLWKRRRFESLAIRHVGQSAVHADDLSRMKIPLPSLTEQREIVTVLSTVDDAIQKTDEIIAKTQQLKKGLMQRLLTQGLGHNKFKQTRIGEMPEEWSLSSLSQVCRIIDCKHRTPKYSDEGYPVVRPGDLKPRRLSLDACLRTTSEEYADLTSNYAPKRGDIVFSRNASFGVASYVTTDEEFAIGQDVVIVTSDSNSTLFYFYVLNSTIIDRQLKKLSTGSTFKRINLEEIRELEVPSPPMSEQEQIAAILSDVDRKIEKENYRKQHLGELKEGLMQVLLTGKVRVKVN